MTIFHIFTGNTQNVNYKLSIWNACRLPVQVQQCKHCSVSLS